MEAVASRETSQTSQTEIIAPSTSAVTPPVLRLRLQKKKSPRRVEWSEGTVDNEEMNKKKSKCCCIYKKPLAFGESSSEDDDECEHCYGHPEQRTKNRKHKHEHNHESNETDKPDSPPEPSDEIHCTSDSCTKRD